MNIDKWRARSVADNTWVVGSLTMKVNPKGKSGSLLSPYIDDVLVKPDTIGNFTGMHDRENRPIFENDLVMCEDEVYRIVRSPKTRELGMLLVFDVVRYPECGSYALKPHRYTGPTASTKTIYNKLLGNIKSLDRDMLRKSENMGEISEFKEQAAIVDISEAKGDKQEYVKQMVQKYGTKEKRNGEG